MVLVERDAAQDSDPAHFRVTKLSPGGETIFSLNYRYTPRRIQAAWVDSVIDVHAARAMELFPSASASRQAVREALFLPRYFPPVSAVVAGRDGTVWLRREEFDGSLITWNVIGPSGQLRATVTAPQKLRIYEVDGNFAWGVEHDEMEIPYVVRYRAVSQR